MTTETVRLGFVGAGYMGQLAHLERYWKLPGIELVAMADGRAATAQLVARSYGIAQVYRDHRELLANAKVDAIVAVLPFALNAQVVEDCLRAGKHVLTEKPQVCTSSRGRQLVSLAAERDLIYCVGFMKRLDPGVRWARQQIERWLSEGTFGPLLSVRLWCGHGNWMWFGDPALDGGDGPAEQRFPVEQRIDWMSCATWQMHLSWINYYSHQTNLARYLIGSDYRLDSVRRRQIDKVESYFIQCRYEPGGAQLYLDFAGEKVPHWNEGFEVKFERAQITGRIPAPLARRQITQIDCQQMPADGTATLVQPQLDCLDGFTSQARHFIAAVRGEEQLLSPAAEAIKETEFAETMMRCLQNQDEQ